MKAINLFAALVFGVTGSAYAADAHDHAHEHKPAGDKLEAKGAFKVGAGTKVVALVSLPGKSAAIVRFVFK